MGPERTFPDGTRPNIFNIALFAVLGSAVGAIVISGAVAGLYSLVEPSWTKDGQAGLAFIVSFPIGTVLGGTFGYVWIKYETPDKTVGYTFSLVGGVTTFICLGIGFLSAGSRELSALEFILTIASPWCVVPLVASLTMLTRGVLILKERKV